MSIIFVHTKDFRIEATGRLVLDMYFVLTGVSRFEEAA
jgi:hypothetical protein